MSFTLARKPFSRSEIPQPLNEMRAALGLMFARIELALVPQGVKLVDANYTATVKDQTITVDASGGARTITLPDPSRVAYQMWTIKKLDASANAVTIDATVDGAASPTLAAQWKSITVQSDGSQYLKLASV